MRSRSDATSVHRSPVILEINSDAAGMSHAYHWEEEATTRIRLSTRGRDVVTTYEE